MGYLAKYAEIQRQLQTLFNSHPKVLILGIGENRMGDDGAGQWISFNLDKQITSPEICIINGGITPEERLSEILDFQPNLMIVIDVVGTDNLPGSVGLFEEKQMLNYLPISSHSMPLPVFVDRCKIGVPNLQMILLGICPYSLQFLESYKLYKEDEYDLDAKEADPNIPFYDFNMDPKMKSLSDEIVALFVQIFKENAYI
ncbi:hypothetical protein NEF87_001630 [Candidatus Lokiarchaeum ossiferum]|uniref:Hydrogenase maturation protease n=1 Tax=Candidatus Lokiarchaeum ossiferum TaxID=2951803 RepID=A0ABY6HP97_9ARCH|nr:hypothetical protein NEF87_001630 [Candidatus Lokiarchaeum sp. B-35]